ncbi:MAG: hypothetical protein WC246_00725 [Candidatus Paceibacterota bacterium]|jgi:hypothetical protein
MNGMTSACLKDYLSHLTFGEKGCVKGRAALMNFVGIKNSDTISRWAKGQVPIGLVLVKLRYFLEQKGYEVVELGALDAHVYQLGKLIAIGKISFDQVVQNLGLAHESEVLQVLHGRRGLSADRMKKVELMCARHSDQNLGRFVASNNGEQNVPKSEASAYGSLESETLHLLKGVDEIVSLLLPRLEKMVIDENASEQRRLFREHAGRQLVFDLSNRFYKATKMLNALCSEKAREVSGISGSEKKS